MKKYAAILNFLLLTSALSSPLYAPSQKSQAVQKTRDEFKDTEAGAEAKLKQLLQWNKQAKQDNHQTYIQNNNTKAQELAINYPNSKKIQKLTREVIEAGQ